MELNVRFTWCGEALGALAASDDLDFKEEVANVRAALPYLQLQFTNEESEAVRNLVYLIQVLGHHE